MNRLEIMKISRVVFNVKKGLSSHKFFSCALKFSAFTHLKRKVKSSGYEDNKFLWIEFSKKKYIYVHYFSDVRCVCINFFRNFIIPFIQKMIVHKIIMSTTLYRQIILSLQFTTSNWIIGKLIAHWNQIKSKTSKVTIISIVRRFEQLLNCISFIIIYI